MTLLLATSFLVSPCAANAQDDDDHSGKIREFFEYLAGLFGGGDDDNGSDGQAGDGDDESGSHAEAGTSNGDEAPTSDPRGATTPHVQSNDASTEFLAEQLEADTGWKKERMIPYAERLAKTLSQYSAKEQGRIFYGP
jgi:hypothetical protein